MGESSVTRVKEEGAAGRRENGKKAVHSFPLPTCAGHRRPRCRYIEQKKKEGKKKGDRRTGSRYREQEDGQQ